MPPLLRRRRLGVLFAGSLAALALAACGPARADPSPEALQVAEDLAETLRAIPQLTDVEAHVTTHLYTEPEILAAATTRLEPDRDDLVSIGTQLQAAVDAHQLKGHLTRAWVDTTCAGSGVKWAWAPTTPDTPTTQHQAAAILEEIERGAASVSLRDGIESRWKLIDDHAALHAAPDGMRRATRWLKPGASSMITTTVHAGEPSLVWPLRQALEPLLPQLTSVSIVAMDAEVKWQLLTNIDDSSEPSFIDSTVTMLKLLRDVGYAGRHTIAYSGPWWVTLLIAHNVTVLEWRSSDDQSRSEAAVVELLDRVNI